MAGEKRYLTGLHGDIWGGVWDERGPLFYPLRRRENSAGNDTIAHSTPGLILTRYLKMLEFCRARHLSKSNSRLLFDDRYIPISCSRFSHVELSDCYIAKYKMARVQVENYSTSPFT